MRRVYKILFCILMPGCLLPDRIVAQEQEKNELSIVAGGGISTLYYQLNNGKYKFDYAGTAGINYSFFFNDVFGISTGGEFALYRSKSDLNPAVSADFPVIGSDPAGYYHYALNNYSEKQEFLAVNIPLLFQFQYPLLFEDHFCYAAIGGRIGVPVHIKYKTSGANLTKTLYDSEGNSRETGSYIENPVNEFVDYNKISWMLSAEVGMKWNLSGLFSLYTGIYCDYGLNDIVKNGHRAPFLILNEANPTAFTNNSIIESGYDQSGEVESFTGKVVPVALGLKLRFTFRIPDPCYK